MRIVIAEDAVLLRAGLVRLLTDAGHQVVAETDTAEGLVKAVEEHRPDFALVDVRLPPSFTDEGIRAAVLIRSAHPQVAVLVLSQYVEERYASELIASRREGWVIYSRTVWRTWTNSWNPCRPWARAEPSWTPRC